MAKLSTVVRGSQKLVKSVAFVVDRVKSPFKLSPIYLEGPRKNEFLIEMKYSGICHTDVVLQQGRLPMVKFPAIFGHEGAGIIRAIGEEVSDKSLKVGDAVSLSYNTCGHCPACDRGQRALCHSHAEVNHNAVRLTDRSSPASFQDGTPIRSQYFGQSSFAKHSVVAEKSVVKCDYPDQMHLYAPLGCGFQTGAGTIINVLKPTLRDSVVIYGLGGVGLAALMAAKYMRVGLIIAVDLNPSRLKLAKELGADVCIDPTKTTNAVSDIKAITNGGAQYAVDCIGAPKTIENCIASVGSQGVVAGIGVPPVGASVNLDPLDMLLQNKTYLGLVQGAANPQEFIPLLIDLHQRGHFPLEKVCKLYPATQLGMAVEEMHNGEVIKPVLSWEEVDIEDVNESFSDSKLAL